ncbi:MAG: putative iron-sulfur cluster-binding metallochaperone, partial [Blastocatellia bacterium]
HRGEARRLAEKPAAAIGPMNCCSTERRNEAPGAEIVGAKSLRSPGTRSCPSCRGASRSVARRTILLMLKPSLSDRAPEGNWRFCVGADCRVVYFAEEGDVVFTTGDLRLRVGLKEREDPIPLCYCFGFDEADAREEIACIGASAIPQKISAMIEQGSCACETRNPSGSCCLGEVIRAVTRLTAID